jgi:hypothetical protein
MTEQLEPSAMSLALAALLLVYLILKELVLPKFRKANGDDGGSHHFRRDGRLWCQAGKFEERISKLEQHDIFSDRDIKRLEAKIDKFIETSGAIATDVAVVKEIVESMRTNERKRSDD